MATVTEIRNFSLTSALELDFPTSLAGTVRFGRVDGLREQSGLKAKKTAKHLLDFYELLYPTYTDTWKASIVRVGP